MIPIAQMTIWQRRWSIFWWSAGIAALVVLTLAFYPALQHQTDQLNKTLDQIPSTARAFISDTNDFFSPVGYLSSQIFYLMLPMLLAVLAIGLGSSLIAKEENDATIELLLSRPISRSRFLAGKGVAGLAVLAAVSAVATFFIVALSWLVKIAVPLHYIFLACVMVFVISALFGALSFCITALGAKVRMASVGIAALVAVGGYVVNSLVSIASWLKWPDRLLPYYYYRPGEVLTGTYNWWNLLGFVIAIFVLALIARQAFARRDIG